GSLASSVSLHVVLIGTGVDVPPTTTMSAMGTAVLLITVLLSVAVQLKSAVPPVFWMTYCTVSVSAGVCVPFTVKPFQPRPHAVPSALLVSKPTSMNGPAPHLICLSTFTLHVSQVSFAVAVSFFRAEGFAGSTDPTISPVTAVVLQEFCVSPAMVPVTAGPVAPAARLAIVLGLTATALLAPLGLPLAGHAAAVKFVSITAQFARSAVPVFCTVIVTALLPLASRSAQSFVTVRPGVWHWKFASSNAVACTSPGVSVQSHVTVALSGSAAESVAEQSAWFAPDVNTHAPLTHLACALPQSTSATHGIPIGSDTGPGSDPTLTAPGNPGLPSPIEQFRRSAMPALPTT